jgi:uncharacterized protein
VAAAEFRFYEELNDFLAPARRRRAFSAELAENATVKHAVESLGVPHTEVELVLVDGVSVGLQHRLHGGERVAVYPVFEAFDVAPLVRLREAPLRDTRFIADAHLGRLARTLRFLGFDTAWRNAWGDAELVAIAAAEQRIVLTRDRALLMRRDVTHGVYLRSEAPTEQLAQLVERLQLDLHAARAARCMLDNTPLETVDKAVIEHRLQPDTRARHTAFWRCPACDRVYWRGSHWTRLTAAVERAVEGAIRNIHKSDTPAETPSAT